MASSQTTHRKLRVGIVGTADIAKKNARAMHESARVECVAVAGRSAEKLAAWIDETRPWLHPDVRALTYDELLSDPDIDAVYMPLPTTTHAEWVTKAARAKKHILLEKPVALTATAFQEMLDVCAACGVRLMDGTMIKHGRRYEALAALLGASDAAITGAPVRVYAPFSFNSDADFLKTNIRVSPQGDPLGALGDLGWYSIRLGLIAFGWSRPESARARVLRSIDGVPTEVEATITMDSSRDTPRVLSIFCSFHRTFQQRFEICTDAERIISCDDFVLPYSERKPGPMVVRVSKGPSAYATIMDVRDEVLDLGPDNQEANMWDSFAQLVAGASGGAWSAVSAGLTPEVAALRTQAVVDLVLSASRSDGGEVPFGSLPW